MAKLEELVAQLRNAVENQSLDCPTKLAIEEAAKDALKVLGSVRVTMISREGNFYDAPSVEVLGRSCGRSGDNFIDWPEWGFAISNEEFSVFAKAVQMARDCAQERHVATDEAIAELRAALAPMLEADCNDELSGAARRLLEALKAERGEEK